MNKKRLFWISIFGVLLLILGVLPWFFGQSARDRLEEQARIISDIPGYDLEIAEYDQGWFTSRVAFTFGFDAHTREILENAAENAENKTEGKAKSERALLDLLKDGASFEATVAHGPVAFQGGIHFALMHMEGVLRDIDSDIYRSFRDKAGVDSFLTYRTTVSYGGKITADVTSPAFAVTMTGDKGRALKITSQGLNSTITMNAALTHYTSEGEAPLFRIEGDGDGLSLQEITFSMEADRLNDHLWLGSGKSAIGALTVFAADKAAFSLKDLNSSYKISRDSAETLQADLYLTLGETGIAEDKVTDGQLDVTFGRLDIDGLTQYVSEIQALSLPGKGQPRLTEEEIAAKSLEIISRTGLMLARRSPEMTLKSLKFNFGDGKFAGIGTLALKGDGLDNIESLNDPQQLLERLAVDLTVGFDQALAEAFVVTGMKQQMASSGLDLSHLPEGQLEQAVNIQTTLMLQTYVNQGFIVMDEENELYNAHIEVKDGQRLINGNPLNIPFGQN